MSSQEKLEARLASTVKHWDLGLIKPVTSRFANQNPGFTSFGGPNVPFLI
jgi:hypothetical protein